MSATATIVLDRRKANKESKYPVKVRVIYDRSSRLYGTGHFLDDDEFEKARSSKSRGEWKDLRLELNRIEERATEIVNNTNQFSFDYFKRQFSKPTSNSKDLYSLFEDYIGSLRDEGRVGTATSYNDACKSFFRFKRRIKVDEITSSWLKRYEKWMLDQGRSLTTIGIYIRSLRTIYNLAVRRGIVANVDYPFGKYAYKIPKGANIKKALSAQEISKLVVFEPKNTGQERARDFFLISYYANGANLADLARLTFKDVDFDSEQLYFLRSKTRKTVENLKPIVVAIIPELRMLIEKWSNGMTKSSDFLFDILKPGMTEEEKRRRILDFNSNLNRRLKQIAKELGFKEHFSFYTARHSFATIMKRSGAPLAFISDSLGHQSLNTTENYLASFEKDQRRKYAEALTKLT